MNKNRLHTRPCHNFGLVLHLGSGSIAVLEFLENGCRKDLERTDCPTSRHPEFHYKTEFQSHEPEV
ncbi:hypothetical protein Scep_000995 [Stephania cephalantha]|uniref:Uncharacterized protein n=1 Tax=Stephania cephalantha TaxID=152367 RepID=A0AAP0Q4M5_9MAGN